MRGHGRLSAWNDERGFGFIEPDDGGPRVFAHINEFPQDKRRPRVSDPLNYEIDFDERGRPRAKTIYFMVPVGERLSSPQTAASLSGMAAPAVVVILFAAVLGLLVAQDQLPSIVYLPYGVFSLVSLAAYRTDKAAAQHRAWRTPESTLHLLALLGGWPGALLAQRLYHHKTRKPSFRFVFWITVLVNCAALAWLMLEHPVSPG